MFDPRLTALLDARIASHDRAAIDQEIWRSFGERLCIMATDLSGFSRGVAEFGIVHFLQTIYESARILVPLVESHRGRLLKMEGDSFLAAFSDVSDGVAASTAMQRALRRYNETRPPHEHVLLGVGLGFGEVLRVADHEFYGQEFNSACILGETYARGYDILVTQSVRDAVADMRFEEFPHVPPGARGAYRLVYEP